MDLESEQYDVLLEEINSLPVVHSSWVAFGAYLAQRAQTSIWKESACQEVSLHAQGRRWHFRVTLSNVRQARSGRA